MGLRILETTKTGGGSSSRSANGSRKAKRTFIVIYDADTPPASLAAVETADDGTTAIPAVDSALADDPTRTATDISVTPRGKTGLSFNVEVEYSNVENAGGEDPLTDPDIFEWDFSASSQPYFRDQATTPKPTVTSAGEPFENLFEAEEGEIVVTFTRNIPPTAWDPVLAAQYVKPKTAINSDAITIEGYALAAGQARFGGARCSGIQTRNGIDYRTRTIVLKLAETWEHKIDDRGYHEKDGTTGKLKEIVKGTPPTKVEKPWPLDGAGAKKPNAGDTPAELTFKPYPAKVFNVWGVA